MRSTVVVGTLVAGLVLALVTQANAGGTANGERRAFFEASQTLLRLLGCVSEAANADADALRSAEAAGCLRRLVDPNIAASIDGVPVNGIDQLLGFAVFGPGATARTSMTIGTFAPRAARIDAGARPGTGTVNLEIVDTAWFEVVEPGPFGLELGPLFIVDLDVVTLVAAEPGEWRIVDLVITRLVTQPLPDAVFPVPFPALGAMPDIE